MQSTKAGDAPTRLRYEPALDGLRGVAVLAVIGYHGKLAYFSGGFLGVDVFFVLSGFLITSLLLAEHTDTGRVDFRAFWARRARRLFPALLLLLLGVAAYSAFIALPSDRGAIRADAFASLVYVQNWHLVWSGVSYFTAYSAPSPLRHLWSLAIEEQFYLVWPLLLLVLLKATRGRLVLLVGTLSAAAFASAVLMARTYHNSLDPSRAYYGTDTRAHELLVGALLACALSRWPLARSIRGTRAQAAGVVGGIGVLWIATHAHDSTRWLYRGGFLAFAIATALIVGSVMQAEAGLLKRVLSSWPLRATGRISYGLYLWHWPVMLWLDPDRTHLHGSALFTLRVAVTYAIAAVSFVAVERPVHAGALSIWRGRRLLTLAAIGVAVVVLAVSVAPRTSTPALDDIALLQAAPPAPWHPGPTTRATTPAERAVEVQSLLQSPSAWASGDQHIEADGRALAFSTNFLPGLDRNDGRPHILMIGDSVLVTLGVRGFDPGPPYRADYYRDAELGCAFLPGVTTDHGRSSFPLPGCVPALREKRWRMLVDRRRPDLSFLLLGAWEVFDNGFDGVRYRVGTVAYANRLRAQLLHDVDLFSSRGGLVALPTVPCFDPPDYDVAGVIQDTTSRRDPRRVAAVNAVIRSVARARPDVVRIVDLGGFLCPNGHPRDRIGGVKMRVDGIHFTPDGARIVSRWLAPRLEALIPAGPVFATRGAQSSS